MRVAVRVITFAHSGLLLLAATVVVVYSFHLQIRIVRFSRLSKKSAEREYANF